MSEFSKVLKNLRQEEKYTQRELGKLLGLSGSAISMYERGEREPELEVLELIADFFNVSLDYLHTGSYLNGFSQENSINLTGTVPVYGSIPAGFPALAQQYIEDYILTTVPNPQDYFALRVKGSSMINAGIVDGCKVLCHKQNTAENGQIVVCRLNGDEATLKRFKQQDDIIILLPENPEYEPQIIPCSKFASGEAEIIGVVKQIIIDL